MKKSELKQIIREEIQIILKESDQILVLKREKELRINDDDWANDAEELFNRMRYHFDYSFSPRGGGITFFKFRSNNEFINGVALLKRKLSLKDSDFQIQESLSEDMKLDVDDFTATLMKDNVTLWIVPKSGKRINEKEMIKNLKPLGIKKIDRAEMDSIKIVFKEPANFWKIRHAIWGK
jgi:hypothetical protein